MVQHAPSPGFHPQDIGAAEGGTSNAENLKARAFSREFRRPTQNGPQHPVSATVSPISQRHSQAQEEAGLGRQLGLLLFLFFILVL